MPLINCPECQKEVSDKAELCPQCGYRLNESSKKVTTIEKTSKKLKSRQLLGLIPLITSCFFSYNGMPDIGLWLGGIGFVWMLIVQFQIWWEHE